MKTLTAPSKFGLTPDGDEVFLITISSGSLSANIMSWGASVQDLRFEGCDFPLVLGFENFKDYLDYGSYFGATVGRCANRIKSGAFSIDETDFEVTKNENGINTLHGANALSHKNWELVGYDASFVELRTIDDDGNHGFPGELIVTAKYSILPDETLRIEYSAETNKPTPVNIAHHSYFNLNGKGDILDHQIEIAAEQYLPVDKNLIPTGEIKAVAGTAFDFTKARTIRSAGGDDFLHDHNFCLRGNEGDVREIVRLHSEKSGLTMTMRTSEIGLQFFTAKGLDVPVTGISGEAYSNYGGMCLEAQKWPDGINRLDFPEMILRPKEKYNQITEYQFSSD